MKVILAMVFLVVSLSSALATEAKLALKVKSDYADPEPTYNEWGFSVGMHTGPLLPEKTAYTFSIKNYFFNYHVDDVAMRCLGVGPMIDTKGDVFLSVAPMGLSVGKIHYTPEINISSNFNEIKLGFSVGYNF